MVLSVSRAPLARFRRLQPESTGREQWAGRLPASELRVTTRFLGAGCRKARTKGEYCAMSVSNRIRWLGRAAAALTFVGTAMLASPASAQVPLAPGDTVVPNAFDPGGTVIDSVSTPFASLSFTGTLTAAVVRTAGGTLDFYYAVCNDPTSLTSLDRVATINFAGFDTDVFYRTDDGAGLTGNPFTAFASNVAPTNADRGDPSVVEEVGFNFASVASGGNGRILAGTWSEVLGVRTNATEYTRGFTGVIDGGVAVVPTFAPAVAASVPEPISTSLLVAGLMPLGLAAIRRRVGRQDDKEVDPS